MALLSGRAGVMALAALAVALGVRPASVRAQETLEQEVKAAFLYNFTKFVEWPTASSGEPFRVCVAADPSFTRVFDQIIAGESVHGRPLVRVDASTPEAVRGCEILYMARPDPRLIAAARQAPVLTVGDAPRFVREGGAIQFVLENNRVRFDISLPALQRSGLKVSSKLLRVARHVDPGGGQ